MIPIAPGFFKPTAAAPAFSCADGNTYTHVPADGFTWEGPQSVTESLSGNEITITSYGADFNYFPDGDVSAVRGYMTSCQFYNGYVQFDVKLVRESGFQDIGYAPCFGVIYRATASAGTDFGSGPSILFVPITDDSPDVALQFDMRDEGATVLNDLVNTDQIRFYTGSSTGWNHGDWNTIKVELSGTTLRVYINGAESNELDDWSALSPPWSGDDKGLWGLLIRDVDGNAVIIRNVSFYIDVVEVP